MTNHLNLEIPPEVREFAEKTVDQARKAFDGYVAAAQKAAAQTEAAAENAAAGVKDMSAKAISYAEANVKAAFDLAENLVKAKDPKEIMAIQTEYLKSQIAAVQEQAKAMGETIKSAITPDHK
ncbi:phasin [Rhodoblastus acidophilus]|uniref:phasin n=1 Tax=Rhodoblastus acidophilus TaxID=1074 RepID=UPI00160BE4A4|nr:phasin [Rhodoblastus acidophilus]MCW2284732.1 phasin [Rhodoblastus acidophilus]MCW2333685.1 phasin [Rhodoblastus acidophilus]